MKKIFIIGFNKTATRAFHNLFKRSGLSSVHWDDGKLAKKIIKNDAENKCLLEGYEQFDAFSDMEFVSKNTAIYPYVTHYRKLFHQYPESYFILNTRSIGDWIKSRKSHGDGLYLNLCMRASNLSEEDITRVWVESFYSHHHDVIQFFKYYDKFIHVDINSFDINELTKFLASDFPINPEYWDHLKLHKARK